MEQDNTRGGILSFLVPFVNNLILFDWDFFRKNNINFRKVIAFFLARFLNILQIGQLKFYLGLLIHISNGLILLAISQQLTKVIFRSKQVLINDHLGVIVSIASITKSGYIYQTNRFYFHQKFINPIYFNIWINIFNLSLKISTLDSPRVDSKAII